MSNVPLPATPAATPAAPAPMDFDQLLAALGHVRNEKEREALNARFEEIASTSPRAVDLHLAWGARLVHDGRLNEALAHLEKARHDAPARPDVLSALGVALHRSGRVDEAVRAFARAAMLHPRADKVSRAREMLNVAESLLADSPDAHARHRAERVAKAVESLAQDDLRAQLARVRGKLLVRADKIPDAAAKLAESLALERNPRTLNTLAHVEAALGHHTSAADHLLAVLTDFPQWFNLTAWLTVFPRLSEAERTGAADRFEAAYPQSRWSAETLVAWGNALLSTSLLGGPLLMRALVRFEQALAAGAEFDAVMGIACVREVQGDRAAALAGYQSATAQAKGDSARATRLGKAFYRLGEWEAAVLQFADALGTDAAAQPPPDASVVASAHLNHGLALAAWGRGTPAIEAYREATQLDPQLRIAWFSLGVALWRAGAFGSAYQAWERAADTYAAQSDAAAGAGEVWHFDDLGWLQHEVFGDLREAEATYLRGLLLEPDDIDLRMRLIALYNEKKETPPDPEPQDWRAIARASAREHAARAEQLLRAELARGAGGGLVHRKLGRLYLETGDLDRAEENLKKGVELLPGDANALNDLGVAYARNEKLTDAIRCFQAAARADDGDWNVRSNLAEAYAKSSQVKRARDEYEAVLATCPQHVESLAGLGEALLAVGEGGDRDAYSLAVKHLTAAITHSEQRTGSTRLRPSQLASALYSRGYARVKQYETAQLRRDDALLREAASDFRACLASDPTHPKAGTALERLHERFTQTTTRRLAERYGPLLVVTLAVVVFLTTHLWMLKLLPRRVPALPPGDYVVLTFTSLAFVVVGLYLPQLLKLKVAGFELEKSSTELISTSVSLNITR